MVKKTDWKTEEMPEQVESFVMERSLTDSETEYIFAEQDTLWKKEGDIMIRNNKRKEQLLRAGLLFMAMLFTVMAAGCRKPSENPTQSGTVFTPSGAGGRVTFTGNTAEVSGAKVGDTVRFGSYEQDNNESTGPEAIEWLVLDKQDGKLLLLSKDALDCKTYHEEEEAVTWETCTLRGWLNSTFYTTAFSTAEQGRIATTKVRNEDNPEYGTEGGNDTEDKVFLLGIGEAVCYFNPDPDAEDPARYAKVTAYAEAQGGYVYSESGEQGEAGATEYDRNGGWWLRSPGYYGGTAAIVYDYGNVDRSGFDVSSLVLVVRPAFWLNPEL